MPLVQQEAKGEGDGTSQATVCHNELVLGGQFDDTELVDHEGQTNHTWEGQSDDCDFVSSWERKLK